METLKTWLYRCWQAFQISIFVLFGMYAIYELTPPTIGMFKKDVSSVLVWIALIAVFGFVAHFILMGLIKLYFLLQGENDKAPNRTDTKLEAEIEEFKRTHPRFNRILRAMRRVNVNLYRTPIALKDIGLLLYENTDEQNPSIWRDGSVPMNSRYLRPFAEIKHWHGQKNQPFEVALEVCDEHSEPLLVDTSMQKWAGRVIVPILSSTWLDMTKISAEKEKQWSVRVRIDGKYLAVHPFTWSQIDEALITPRKDGEISQELSHLLEKEKHLTSISLDELLAE